MSAIPWLFAAIVWLPVAFAGALGFVPLVGILGLSSLFFTKTMKMHPYMWVLCAAILYASISSLWSPYTTPLVEIDISNSVFNVKSAVLRIALIALFGAGTLAAAKRVSRRSAKITIATVIAAICLQAVILILIAHNWDAAYALLAPLITDHSSAVLNLSRNATVFSLGAVLLIAVIRDAKKYLGQFWHVLAAVVCFVSVYYLNRLSASAAAISVFMAWLFMFLPDVFGKHTFRVLGYVTSAFIVLSPLCFSLLIATIGERKEALELSFLWRVEIWTDVIRQTSESPIWGRGLDSLRTFDAVFQEGVWKGERIIPMHAHNMLLHIWIETGYVGVFLTALSVLLLGHRIPAPSELGPKAASAACGVWGACLVICTLSFSLWNDWWWSLIVVTIGFVIMLRNSWLED